MAEPDIEPMVFTVAEAAKALRVTERTIYRRIADGIIPTVATPFTDDIRIPVAALRALIDGPANTGPTAA